MFEAREDGVVLGGYRTLIALAKGGMGAVYVARHAAARGVERLVVIKRIHPHFLDDREIVDMLTDEARITASIRSPHVVSVDDAIEHEGELLLVQPFIESVDLATLLRAAHDAGERLYPAIASRIVADALTGLDGAHRARDLRGRRLDIVHRDVSPHNIVVGTDGQSRVIDFGIARAARRITLTKSGVLKGKVPYMAPEQLRRQPLDARCDVFSAGVVLYEALAGRRPFRGEDEADTLLSILMGEPEPLTALVAALPTAIDAVVERALTRSPEARFPDAASLHDALVRAIPPASPREVAACVERLCGDTISSRRDRIHAAIAALDAPITTPRQAERERALTEGPTSTLRGRVDTVTAPGRVASVGARGVTAALIVGAGLAAWWSLGGKKPPPAAENPAHSATTAPAVTATLQSAAETRAGVPVSSATATLLPVAAAPPARLTAPPRPSASSIPSASVSRPLHKNPYASPD